MPMSASRDSTTDEEARLRRHPVMIVLPCTSIADSRSPTPIFSLTAGSSLYGANSPLDQVRASAQKRSAESKYDDLNGYDGRVWVNTPTRNSTLDASAFPKLSTSPQMVEHAETLTELGHRVMWESRRILSRFAAQNACEQTSAYEKAWRSVSNEYQDLPFPIFPRIVSEIEAKAIRQGWPSPGYLTYQVTERLDDKSSRSALRTVGEEKGYLSTSKRLKV